MIRKIAAVFLALVALTACAAPKSEEQKKQETPAVIETLNAEQVDLLAWHTVKRQPKIAALKEAAFEPKAIASNEAGQWVYYCNTCTIETPDWERPRVLMYMRGGAVIDSAFSLELPAPERADKTDVLRCITAKPLSVELIAEFGEVSKAMKAQVKVSEIRQGTKELKNNTFTSAAGNAWDCRLKTHLTAP